MKNKARKCWERFSIPTVSTDQDGAEILEFVCDTSNMAFTVYYQKSEPINADALSEFMNRALSTCLHCTQSKLDCRSEDSE